MSDDIEDENEIFDSDDDDSNSEILASRLVDKFTNLTID
jgi:hypothetical protein